MTAARMVTRARAAVAARAGTAAAREATARAATGSLRWLLVMLLLLGVGDGFGGGPGQRGAGQRGAACGQTVGGSGAGAGAEAGEVRRGVALVDPLAADSLRVLAYLPVARVGEREVVRASALGRVVGATRYWRADLRKVVLKRGAHKVRLTIDNRFAVRDDTPFSLRAPAVAVAGEPAVPVFAVAQVLEGLTDAPFRWDAERHWIEVPAALVREVRSAGGAIGERATIPLTAAEPPRAMSATEMGPAALAAAGRAVRRVVIDPGHGGDDAGVRGNAGGLSEADLALDVARRLRAALLRAGAEQVVLTRESNNAVTIDERAAIANGSGADLLVSLHANWAWVTGARGFEVYCMSDPRGTAAAAEQERLRKKKRGTELEFIPWDQAYVAHVASSWERARAIQIALAAVPRAVNRGVNRAPLLLERCVNLPAVEVDLGYLSNPRDAELLADAGYRQELAQALAAGILAQRAAVQEVRP